MKYCAHGKAWLLHVSIAPFGFTNYLVNRFARITALAFLAIATTTSLTYAQSNAEGSVLGRVVGTSAADLSGATATLSSKQFNINRTAPVSANGTFEFPGVPVGDYEVALALKGREPITDTAHVGIATTTSVRFEPGAAETVKLEKFVVSGADASPVDVASTVIGLSVRSETVDMLPVQRNLTAVTLLTPGVTSGDRGFFGDLASFAGASVGENAYYLNGYNITDFRRGLGFGTVPFQFFSEFQTLTSGYSAEFGRSTGGVVNAASKRGSNEYKASVGVIYEPKGLNENGFDTYGSDGKVYVVRSIGSAEVKTYNIEASGPIWKNHLYFYGLYQGNKTEYRFHRRRRPPAAAPAPPSTSGTSGATTSPFWAGKIDWQIAQDHQFEYTTFSDRSDQTTEAICLCLNLRQ